jgi:glycine cleavage system H protein
MRVDPGLYYTKEHEWVAFQGDGTATLGISDYAQDKLGDVVYVEFLMTSGKTNKGEPLVSLESVKAVAEVYAPFGAQILSVNEELPQNPGSINQDTYGQGWMVKLKPIDPNPKALLMEVGDYEEYLKGL